MTWEPCRPCNALGWITEFETHAHGAISICHDCAGQKGHETDVAKQRVLLGTCKFCSQEIHFPGTDTPCSLGRKEHVIPGLGGGNQ